MLDEPGRRYEAPQLIGRHPRHPQVRFDPQQNQVNITVNPSVQTQPLSGERPREKEQGSLEDDKECGTKIVNWTGFTIVGIIVLLYWLSHIFSNKTPKRP
uniref:Uncharacterized protein n=1 Tax=Trichogramma kaykai TaxID=54128 RepID=A0ABD2XKC8_9HYME